MTMRLRGGILLGGLAVLVSLLGLGLLGLPSASAQAQQGAVPASSVTQPVAEVAVARAQQDQPTPEPGPQLDPSDKADSERNQNKVVVGVLAAVLAVIVLWGRHIRSKRRKSNS